MELTKEQKIEALKYALEGIKREVELSLSLTDGMCNYLMRYIDKELHTDIYTWDIKKYLPEFERPKETLHRNSPWWWSCIDFDSRINYLENLIKQIETQA